MICCGQLTLDAVSGLADAAAEVSATDCLTDLVRLAGVDRTVGWRAGVVLTARHVRGRHPGGVAWLEVGSYGRPGAPSYTGRCRAGGRLWRRRGGDDGAISALKRAVAVKPSDPAGWAALVDARLQDARTGGHFNQASGTLAA